MKNGFVKLETIDDPDVESVAETEEVLNILAVGGSVTTEEKLEIVGVLVAVSLTTVSFWNKV